MMPANRFDRTTFGEAAEDEFRSGQSSSSNGAKGPDAFRHLQSQLEELGDYARLYVSAKKDSLTASVRRIAIWAAIGLATASIAITAVIVATVLTMVGIAQLVGDSLGGRLWAGYLITGGGLLLLLAIVAVVALTTLQSRLRKRTVQKYERRHQAQRARFGHDASGQPEPRT